LNGQLTTEDGFYPLPSDQRFFCPRSGTGLAESETGQAEPYWPASADWLSDSFLPKAALRPRMLFRALRPGVIFASLASADIPRRLAPYFGSDRLFSRLLASATNVSK
jgi:hypothetical protein